MDSLFPFIIMIVAISSVAGVIKAGLAYHARRIPAADREAFRRLEQGLLEMRDELGAVREEVVDLQERVDFAERMLARGREEERRIQA